MATLIRFRGTIIVCAIAMTMQAAPIVIAQLCGTDKGLAPEVLQGFALLGAHDTNGLGAEALKVDSWRAGRTGLRMCRSTTGGTLSDDAGTSIGISGRLAQEIPIEVRSEEHTSELQSQR